jgi:hypothetical protein
MNNKTHTKTLSHRIPKQNTTHNPNKNILKPTLIREGGTLESEDKEVVLTTRVISLFLFWVFC